MVCDAIVECHSYEMEVMPPELNEWAMRKFQGKVNVACAMIDEEFSINFIIGFNEKNSVDVFSFFSALFF